MNRQVLGVLIALGTAGLFGCVGRPVESFTLEVDLPANFKLKTAANYRPATGKPAPCRVVEARGRNAKYSLPITHQWLIG